MKKIAGEFRTFVMRGNVIDLAVGIIVGGAFGKIVSSLVADIFMPVLSLIIGKFNISEAKLLIIPASEGVEELSIRYGAFLQTVIDFVFVAFAVFLLVKGINALRRKKENTPTTPPAPPRQEALLEEIRDLLSDKNSAR